MIHDVFFRLVPAVFRHRWALDEYEQRFERIVMSRAPQWLAENGPRILVQMPKDYFCLVLFSVAVAALRPSALAGLWHQSILSMPRASIASPEKAETDSGMAWTFSDRLSWSSKSFLA